MLATKRWPCVGHLLTRDVIRLIVGAVLGLIRLVGKPVCREG